MSSYSAPRPSTSLTWPGRLFSAPSSAGRPPHLVRGARHHLELGHWSSGESSLPSDDRGEAALRADARAGRRRRGAPRCSISRTSARAPRPGGACSTRCRARRSAPRQVAQRRVVAGALGVVPLDEEDVVGQLVEDPLGHGLERALVDPHRAVVAAADVQAEGHVGGEALDHAAVELERLVQESVGSMPWRGSRTRARPRRRAGRSWGSRAARSARRRRSPRR